MGDINLDVYITANSPGEITGWVTPVIRELRVRAKRARVTLVIVPCQYASGAEEAIGAASGADRVIRIGALRETLRAGAADRAAASARRLALHLGGDLFFSIWLSRQIKAPLWVYCSRPRWGRFVARYFVPDEQAERRFAILDFPKERYTRIGHLALDSVALTEDEEETRGVLRLAPGEPAVAMLTGSRPIEYLRAVPYLAEVAGMIAGRFPDHRMLFPLAPTVDDERLRAAVEDAGLAYRGESRVYAIDIGCGRFAEIVRGRTLETLNVAKLAIAVPGTSNLQAAALYTPLIMALPLDRADEYPVDGIAGVLPLWIPGVRSLKKRYIRHLAARTPYISLPNRIAGRAIVPEIRGVFPKELVAARAIELLGDEQRLQAMSRAFLELTHERGAASRLAAEIASLVKSPN